MNIHLQKNNMIRSIIILLWMLLAGSQALSARERSSYVPPVSPQSGEPPCAHGHTYCVEVNDYPADIIVKLLKSAPQEIIGFLKNSVDTKPNDGSHNTNKEFPDNILANATTLAIKKKEEQLCQAHSRTIRPLVARDTWNEWRYIVNLNDYQQPFEVEVCTNEGKKCNIGYRKDTIAICEQKMMAKRLLALDPSGHKLTWLNGVLPTCCQCTLYDEPRLLL